MVSELSFQMKWYDGYSIFYVDGEGLVYKATIQRTMPDDSLQSVKNKTKEFAKRVGVLPNSTQCSVMNDADDHEHHQRTTTAVQFKDLRERQKHKGEEGEEPKKRRAMVGRS